MNIEQDKAYMQVALALAQRAVGRSADNPAVGCIIVKNGQIIGQGWTADGGRPHAETEALSSSPYETEGATAYVTLEPCSHYGRTPPCALALIHNGIKRVVVACHDDDKRVAGKGIQMLREAGCQVIVGIMEEEARQLNHGFFRRINENLPEISVKIATSSDHKITSSDAGNRWITGNMSRRYGHILRMKHQAIVTGIGTVLADDPLLTCRLPGLEHTSPIRVVLDRELRIPTGSQLVQTAKDYPLWLLTSYTYQDSAKAQELQQAGVTSYFLPPDFHFEEAMNCLAGHGINRVLVEGGQALTTTALLSGLTDTLYWFKAPHMIGEKGLKALGGEYCLSSLAESLSLQTTIPLEQDRLFIYQKTNDKDL